MRWLLSFFRPPPPPPDDDLKARIERRKRELDRRSDENRARLTEIQVDVIARRNDHAS